MKAFHEVRNYTDNFKVWQSDYEDISFLAHWHRELELIYVCSGEAYIHVGDEEFCAHEGDLVFVDSEAFHYCNSFGSKNHLDFIVFDPSIISSRYRGILFRNTLITAEQLGLYQMTELTHQLFQEVSDELSLRRPFYEQIVSAKLREFLYLLRRNHPCYADAASFHLQKDATIETFRHFLDYLDEHFGVDITVSFAAAQMNFSEGYFSKTFKKLTGMNFVPYLNAIRIEHAAHLLLHSDLKIADISHICGYGTIRSFNRTFKEYTGFSPSQFLKLPDIDTGYYSFYRRNLRQEEFVSEDSITVVKNT